MPAGRPSSYTPKIADEICRRMEAGQSLLAICKADNMPSRTTIYEWRRKHPEFADNYARAESTRAAHVFDQILDLADDPHCRDVQQLRVQVDARKWILARMDSKNYGDKSETTLRGDPENPISTRNEHLFSAPASPEARAKLTSAVRDAICGGEGE